MNLKELSTAQLIGEVTRSIHTSSYTDILREIERRLDQGGKAMRALENLTVGGSEFVGHIDTCVNYIREKQNSLHNLVITKQKKINELENEEKLPITT